jgi:hypothetical protein
LRPPPGTNAGNNLTTAEGDIELRRIMMTIYHEGHGWTYAPDD